MAKEPEQNKTAEKDPDNVWVNQGKKDPSKVYVKFPYSYRDTAQVVKGLEGKFVGDQWELDKEVFAKNEEKIREAARGDIALGKEGRKEREQALAAEKEQKSADWQKAKANRILVKEGSVEAGAEVDTPDGKRPVNSVGQSFEVTEAGLERLKEGFPDADVKVGDKVAYAYYEAPEPEADAETPTP